MEIKRDRKRLIKESIIVQLKVPKKTLLRGWLGKGLPRMPWFQSTDHRKEKSRLQVLGNWLTDPQISVEFSSVLAAWKSRPEST